MTTWGMADCRRSLSLIIALCLSISSLSSAAPEASKQGVAIAGVIIHPAWIELMSGHLADPLPVVTAIDLDAAARSNRFIEGVELDGEWIRGRTSSEPASPVVECRRIALSKGGTYAFEVRLSSQGSGVFRSLVLLRVVVDEVNGTNGLRKRRTLVCRAVYDIGDRDPGKLTHEGNRIIIEKSPNRPADIVIELD